MVYAGDRPNASIVSVVVGGYATITDASPDEYGEGIYQRRICFRAADLFSSGPTRSRAAIGWTPLTRDGGQQLGRKFGLYDKRPVTQERNSITWPDKAFTALSGKLPY